MEFRAHIDFGVRGLQISSDMLGTQHVLVRTADRTIVLQFPEIPLDAREGSVLVDPRFAPTKVGAYDTHGLEVLIVRTLLLFAVDEVSTASTWDEKRVSVFGRATQLMIEAQRFLAIFLAWVRLVHRQRHLGLSGEVPRILNWDVDPTESFDPTDGGRVTITTPPPIDMGLNIFELGSLPLNVGDMGPLTAHVARSEQPPIAETLLVDAEAIMGGIWSDEALRRAILTMAIACELKIKGRLRELVEARAAPFLDIILDYPRDVTLAVRALLDRGMKAVSGRSLREEDAELYKTINKLFESRNAIAHRGATPVNATGAWELVRAARRCFEWLDGLPTGPWPRT